MPLTAAGSKPRRTSRCTPRPNALTASESVRKTSFLVNRAVSYDRLPSKSKHGLTQPHTQS